MLDSIRVTLSKDDRNELVVQIGNQHLALIMAGILELEEGYLPIFKVNEEEITLRSGEGYQYTGIRYVPMQSTEEYDVMMKLMNNEIHIMLVLEDKDIIIYKEGIRVSPNAKCKCISVNAFRDMSDLIYISTELHDINITVYEDREGKHLVANGKAYLLRDEVPIPEDTYEIPEEHYNYFLVDSEEFVETDFKTSGIGIENDEAICMKLVGAEIHFGYVIEQGFRYSPHAINVKSGEIVNVFQNLIDMA